ncbi:hypothetical protein ACKFKF_27105 [Phormidesmis sp. 146-12]
METKVMVPGDKPTITDHVEPSHSRPPEGAVLPKVPFPVFWATGILIGVSIFVFAVVNDYFSLAH